MDSIAPILETLSDVRKTVRRESFPEMSDDESDAFDIGYWAGVMALTIGLPDDGLTTAEIASQVESELRQIQRRGSA